MLRLDPRHPPLFRGATSLQFGVDAVVVVDPLTRWQERLIGALVEGIPAAAFDACARAFGAQADSVPPFRRLLEPVLREVDDPPRPVVRLELPHDLDATLAETLTDAFTETGAAPESAPWWDLGSLPIAPGPPVVAVAAHVLDPRRTARFMRDDVRHLPIVLSPDRVEVGPLVIPGVTACPACLDAHRRDADAAWPAIAVQLLRLPSPATPRSILYDAAILARRMVSARPGSVSRSATIRVRHGRPTWHEHRPHADCHCRSLARTGRSVAPVVPFPAPTTVTASARRA